ncbi:hypothetical protein N5A93_18330, partial [Roseovarius sp. EGI FJ00037]|uniref:hypothetical protein n=1 Tax=Roseovarius salincola TaxID=2978479 RepID=UPI0022A85B4F
ISCSSSLLDGCDEPEILRYENIKSVPWVLTSDNALSGDPLLPGRKGFWADLSEIGGGESARIAKGWWNHWIVNLGPAIFFNEDA